MFNILKTRRPSGSEVDLKHEQLLVPVSKLFKSRLPLIRHSSHVATAEAILAGGMDPRVLGYDQRQYDVIANIREEADVLDYVTAGQDNVRLPTDMMITGILLSADPYEHDVALAVIVPVTDAPDKVISALNITGGLTFFQLSSTLLFLKGLANNNKVIHGGALPHEDLATAIATANQSRQAWYLHFGAFNDYDPFDVTAGIPAQGLNQLVLSATFGANNLIAATAANGTVTANTDIYALVMGVTGLPREYLNRLPIPEFKHNHVTSPGSTITENLQAKRYLKRTTIINLGVAASNNEPRQDSNVTNISLRLRAPNTGESFLFTRVRWRNAQTFFSLGGKGVQADKDGSVALLGRALDGVMVIDWRQISHNPYGLDLMDVQENNVALIMEMGVTTGSVHFFHEYYALPDPSVARDWPAWKPS